MERNSPCRCGSGLKYKKCCLEIDERMKRLCAAGFTVPARSLLKTEAQIAGIEKSGAVNTALLDFIAPYVVAGANTEALDALLYEETLARGGIPAPLNYKGFPKSCCISINHVVCHGIPFAQTTLQQGDIVNIDVSTILDGYYSDSSRMFCVGAVSPEKQRLVDVAKACMEQGVKEICPWGFLGDMSHAIYSHAEENGFSVVQEIGGHGIGLAFHEDPWVSYVIPPGTGTVLVPGMVFTIEPMVNMGSAAVCTKGNDDWTVYTKDGLPSAQWECTVLVTNDGCRILAR